MRRTLLLDEDDLIMVVKEDVVKQIDENRGEMTRTEFVTYLLQCQLKRENNQKEYVSRQEFEIFTQKITELLSNFLQFFVSCGMVLGNGNNNLDVQELFRQLDSSNKQEDDSPDSELF